MVSGGAGDYTLALVSNPGPNPGDEDLAELASGRVIQGTFSSGDIDVYWFDAIVGDKVKIHLAGADYPALELHGPTGFIQSANSFSSQTGIESDCLAESGRYLIFARGAATTEPYELTFEKSPEPLLAGSPDGTVQIIHCGTTVLVRWRISAEEYLLESAATLAGAGGAEWAQLVGPYSVSGEFKWAIVPITEGNQFLRLRKSE